MSARGWASPLVVAFVAAGVLLFPGIARAHFCVIVGIELYPGQCVVDLLSVEADGTSTQDEVVLSVRDDGRGIPAEELDGMFQPFHSSFEGGTGLGLATVHRIVSDYGGVIQVSSTVGVGTTVRVRLPVRTASAIAAAAVPGAKGSVAL